MYMTVNINLGISHAIDKNMANRGVQNYRTEHKISGEMFSDYIV
jgi:hypothetical protein